MEITRIGQQGFLAAQERAERHSGKLVRKGPEIDDVVGLKVARQEAAVAAKVIKVGLDIEKSLLDILA